MKYLQLYTTLIIVLLVAMALPVWAEDAQIYPHDNDEDYKESYYYKKVDKDKAVKPAENNSGYYKKKNNQEDDSSSDSYAKHPADNDNDYKAPPNKKDDSDNFYPNYFN